MSLLEVEIKKMIYYEIEKLNRPDLFRAPLVAFSSAEDKRYEELKNVIGDWHRTPKELFPDAKTVISYFVPFTKEVVMAPKLSKQESPLWGEAYAVINNHFDQINNRVCEYLHRKGYLSYTIPATHTYNEADMKSMWSHRSAAAIAGLGSFGANRMLITEKGSSGRFCTVLTSAVLETSNKVVENRCLYFKNNTCGLCFKACPVSALKPDFINKFACQAETRKNEKLLEESIQLYSADTCGKCISVCPVAYLE